MAASLGTRLLARRAGATLSHKVGRTLPILQCQLCARPMSTEPRNHENRVAFVTGSTSGIGLGIARSLASRGCNVILNGFGDEQLIETLKSDISKDFNSKADFLFADLTKPAEIETLCATLKEKYPSGIDILVNNAGFQNVSPVEDFPTEKWDAMIAIMLSAPFHLIKHLLPAMKTKGWGRILNVASVHGVRASPNKAAYVSAKHGIVGLTKVVALETAGSGVTCNAICPGYVDTPILKMQVQTMADKEGLSYDEAEAKFLAYFHPSKKAVGIDQLGEMAAFLCSDSASQMTGISLIADGGWTAK